MNVELLVEPVPGLASEDELAQPGEQESLRRLGFQRHLFRRLGAHLVEVDDDVPEESGRGGAEEVIQVVGDDPQANVGGVVEGFDRAHEWFTPRATVAYLARDAAGYIMVC